MFNSTIKPFGDETTTPRQDAIEKGSLILIGYESGKSIAFSKSLYDSLENKEEEISEIVALGFQQMAIPTPEDKQCGIIHRKLNNNLFVQFRSFEGYTFMTRIDL